MDIYLKVFEQPVDPKLRKLVDEPVNEDLIKKNKYANNAAYIPDSVYRKVLNRISNYQWSFVPHSMEEKDGYVQFVGLLIVPGFGVHTGVGTAKLNKKDASNAFAAAKTYAFKNACKEMGLAPNIGDEDWDEPVFENFDDEELDFAEEEEPKKEKKKAEPKKSEKKTDKKADKKPAGKSAGKKLTQEERIEEVRTAYELDKDDDFVAFIQIWDEDILDLDDMDDDDWDEFLDYLEENKDEFEEF